MLEKRDKGLIKGWWPHQGIQGTAFQQTSKWKKDKQLKQPEWKTAVISAQENFPDQINFHAPSSKLSVNDTRKKTPIHFHLDMLNSHLKPLHSHVCTFHENDS